MSNGCISLILHAHLPYIRHIDNYTIEERWLFEAISETYIPLLNIFNKLIDEGMEFKIAMSLTPPLVSMLRDDLLSQKYIKYLNNLIGLCRKEILRNRDNIHLKELAAMYYNKFTDDLYRYQYTYQCNLTEAFKELQDRGYIEIIACSATHAFLPLMDTVSESINAQIAVGVDSYFSNFSRAPKGFWLPECGYNSSLDTVLKKQGIEYVICESHGIFFADPQPVFGTMAPIVTPKGLVAYGRDADSSKQVWSSTEGYPGDYNYRDFYKDIGYELDYNYIKDYISPDGQRIATGIKYYKITGNNEEKQLYNPATAKQRAEVHAEDFLAKREKQLKTASESMNMNPIVVCPYDAELFGHWWYEGPEWLYHLIRKLNTSYKSIAMVTPGEYLKTNPVMQVSQPCASSWGTKGYNEVWLNKSNDWIYRYLHKACIEMTELADKYPYPDQNKKHALNQAARELLLAQSSDWAFIMKNQTVVPYAIKRTKDHLSRFRRLYNDITNDTIDEEWLNNIESLDNIFSSIDYSIFRSDRSANIANLAGAN